MSIFGNQGKGRTGHPSERFDLALFWDSSDLGSDALGTSGSEGRIWALLDCRAASPAPVPACSSWILALWCAPGRRAGQASFLPAKRRQRRGWGLLRVSCDCDFAFGSFSRHRLAASPEAPRAFQTLLECEGRWGLSCLFHRPGVGQVSGLGRKQTR